MSDLLFDIKPSPPKKPPTFGGTCRTCTHRQRWQCGGSVIQYCGVSKDRRTFNRLKKIKVYMSCPLYKKEE